jgi:hypothetical protein
MCAELVYVATSMVGALLAERVSGYLEGGLVILLLLFFLWFAFRSVHNVLQNGREYVFKPKFLWKVMPFPLAALGAWVFFETAAVLWFRIAIGLGICALAIGAYPKVIRFDDSGISSKNWLGRPIQIRWDEITKIRRASGSRYTSEGYDIRDSNGTRIRVLDQVYDTESMIRILRSKAHVKVEDLRSS